MEKIQEYWDDYVVWYLWDKPKDVYKTIRHWWWVNGSNPWTWKLIWFNLFHNQPWDYYFMWKSLWYQLNKQYYYFSHTKAFTLDDEHRSRILSKIGLCIKLLNPILNDSKLWAMVPKDNVDETDPYYRKVEYKCLINVNTKNAERFAQHGVDINNPAKLVRCWEYFLKEPHELYLEKARQLVLRIISEHSGKWWD